MPMLMTVADAFSRVALPLAGAYTVAELRHPLEYGVHLGNDIHAVHDDGGPFWCAQGDVQHRAILRDVDLLSPEHGVDTRAQPGFFSQLHQEAQGLVGDPVFRVIEVNPRRFQRQSLAALRILRKKRAQVYVPDLLVVGFEGLPGRARGGRLTVCCHACLLVRCYRGSHTYSSV